MNGKTRQYFWLNANPKEWCFHELPVGEEESWSLYNSDHNKRMIFEDFCAANKGDFVLGFQSTPTKKIVSICKVTQSVSNPDDEKSEVFVKKLIDIPNGITKDDISSKGITIKPLTMEKGSFYKIDEESFKAIVEIIEEQNPELLSELKASKQISLFDCIQNITDQEAYEYAIARGSLLMGWEIPIGKRFTEGELGSVLQLPHLSKRDKTDGAIKISKNDQSSFVFPVDEPRWINWEDEGSFGIHFKWIYEEEEKISYFESSLKRYGLEKRVHVIRTINNSIYEYVGVAEISFYAEDKEIIRKGDSYSFYGDLIEVELYNADDDEDYKLLKDVGSVSVTEILDGFEYNGEHKGRRQPLIVKGRKIYPRDRQTAINALAHAHYACEVDKKHPVFIRRTSDKGYTEPHHLIPMAFQDRFDVSLDVEENIVSLCSNCHNQIHYGKDADKLLKMLYESRKKDLEKVGIKVTFDELIKMYHL